MMRDIDEPEILLEKWAEWMRRPDPVVDGYPVKASGGFISSWIKDDEELCEAADAREMEAVNASIDSLNAPHKQIICKRHGIGYQVWRFVNETELYQAAKQAFARLYYGKCMRNEKVLVNC